MSSHCLVLVELRQLLLDLIGAASDFNDRVADFAGLHPVAREGAGHDEHGSPQNMADREAAVSQAPVQGQGAGVSPRQHRRSHTNPKRERGSDEIK